MANSTINTSTKPFAVWPRATQVRQEKQSRSIGRFDSSESSKKKFLINNVTVSLGSSFEANSEVASSKERRLSNCRLCKKFESESIGDVSLSESSSTAIELLQVSAWDTTNGTKTNQAAKSLSWVPRSP